MDVIKNIDRKFTSGNSIEVERAQLTKQEWEAVKSEIAELSAQLARCVLQRDESMEWNWLDEGVPEDTVIYCTQDTLDTAKADAEVLRCAEEETKLHKVGVDASGEISEIECNCALCNAVRATREE